MWVNVLVQNAKSLPATCPVPQQANPWDLNLAVSDQESYMIYSEFSQHCL